MNRESTNSDQKAEGLTYDGRLKAHVAQRL